MDPVSAIGIASACITFFDITAKLIGRIKELSEVRDVPKVFRNVATRLPLVLSIVSRTLDAEDTLAPDARESFRALVDNCFQQVQRLGEILQKVTVDENDNKLKVGRKALRSLVEEGKVQRIASALQENIALLTLLHTLPSEKQSDAAAGKRRGSEAPPPLYPALGYFMIPFHRDEHFVGREKALSEVDRLITEQKRVAIAGPGGIGKSQVAIEYAFRFHEHYPDADVFWVYGGTAPRYYQAYKRIAQKLQLPSWDDPDVSILDLVLEHLNETDKPYLLILDNADDIEYYWPAKHPSKKKADDSEVTDLSAYLPYGASEGHVLITSRDQRIAGRLMKKGTPVTLPAMDQSEAKTLFLSQLEGDHSSLSEESILQIVTDLDCLPLAISQAAAFINENYITAEEYLEALHGDDAEEFLDEELNDSRRDEASVNSTFRAWKVSFDRIQSQSPEAADLLSLLAVFDRQSIPKFLLEAYGLKRLSLAKSVSVLQHFHMVTTRAGSESLQLHRLTQRFVQLTLKRAGTLDHYQAAGLKCITKVQPTWIGVGDWETCDLLSPHVELMLEYTFTSKEARLDLAWLLCWAADFDIDRGLYRQATLRGGESLDIHKQLVEPPHEGLASAYWLYGRILYYMARSEEQLKTAAALLQTCYDISEKGTASKAESAFELAHIYYDLFKEEECLKMAEANWRNYEERDGLRSVRCIDVLHDYSLELAMWGHVDKAIDYWNQVIRLCPETSDMDANTRMIFTYRSMACIAEFEGDPEVAETFFAKLVSICTGLYSAQHIHVFDYRLSHAEMLMIQGKYDESIDRSEDILDTCENKSEWQIQATAYETLAECYRRKGWYAEELDPRERCLEFPKGFLGLDNMDTIDATASLARCYINNSRFGEAVPLLERVAERRTQFWGAQWRDTLAAVELLGICKLYLKDYPAAKGHFLQAIENSEEAHPRLHINLCCALRRFEDWGEVERVCTRVLQPVEDETVTDESATPNRDDSLRNRAFRMLFEAIEKQDRTDETLTAKVEALDLEDAGPVDAGRTLCNIDSQDLFNPVQPPYDLQEQKRFGRVFHPRTYSS